MTVLTMCLTITGIVLPSVNNRTILIFIYQHFFTDVRTNELTGPNSRKASLLEMVWLKNIFWNVWGGGGGVRGLKGVSVEDPLEGFQFCFQ